MKKYFLLITMMMVSVCMSAQKISDFISEETKDVAYSAPNAAFVNKKWKVFNIFFDLDQNHYCLFKANNTGEEVIKVVNDYYSYELVLPFKWSRNHNKLARKFSPFTYRKIVYKDNSVSPRRKAEIKQDIEKVVKGQNSFRGLYNYPTYDYYINRLDNKFFLLEVLGRFSYDECFCTEAGVPEVEEAKNKRNNSN